MKQETKDKLAEWYTNYKAQFDLIDDIVKQVDFKDCYPLPENILNAFFKCPYNKLNCLILGQDSYPGTFVYNGNKVPYATGISFGNPVEARELAPSLQKIKEEVLNQGYIFLDQSLESWAAQGVLLLNSALTVKRGVIGSHTEIWKPFIGAFLKEVTFRNPGLIVVLVGKQAQGFINYLSFASNILKISHPASACYSGTSWDSSNVFNEINQLLMDNNGFKIAW